MNTGNLIALIFVIILLIGSPIFALHAIKSEKKEFNNGICPRCKSRLVHADTDSQGGRLYTCPGCNKYSTWVSYGCVDKEYRKEELRKYYEEDGLGDRYGNKLN